VKEKEKQEYDKGLRNGEIKRNSWKKTHHPRQKERMSFGAGKKSEVGCQAKRKTRGGL